MEYQSMSNKFQIEKVLVSSTLHLTDEDIDLIECEAESFGAPYEISSEGFYESKGVYLRVCNISKDVMKSSNPSEGFALVYLFAESFECKQIYFKEGGPVYDGIPTYYETELNYDACEAPYDLNFIYEI